MNKELRQLLHRAAAAIETPDDLTPEELAEVANDLHDAADANDEPPTPIPGEGQKVYTVCVYGDTSLSIVANLALTDEELHELSEFSTYADLVERLEKAGAKWGEPENNIYPEGMWIQTIEGNPITSSTAF